MNARRALAVALAVIIILSSLLVYVRAENEKYHFHEDTDVGSTVGTVLQEEDFPDEGSRLWVYGNANQDDRIDEDDVEYLQAVIDDRASVTPLCDTNCDGTVDMDDVDYLRRIIASDRMDVFYIDNYYTIAKVSWPVNSIAIGYCSGAYVADLTGLCDKVVMVDDTIRQYWSSMNPAFSEASSYGTTESPNYERMVAAEIDVYVVGYCDETADSRSPTKLSSFGIDVMFISTADNSGVDIPNENIDRSILMFAFLLQGDLDKTYEYLAWHDEVLGILSEATESIPEEDRCAMIMARSSLLYAPGTISITGKDNTNNIHAEWVGVYAVGQHSSMLQRNYQDLNQEQILALVLESQRGGVVYYVDNEHDGMRGQYDLGECIQADISMLSSSSVEVYYLGMAREMGNSPLYVVEAAFYVCVMYPDVAESLGIDYVELFWYYFENFSSYDYWSGLDIDDFFLDYGTA